MPRVLIPTQDDSIAQIVDGYQAIGWEAVKGTAPFYEGPGNFDLVHFFWPEEFCHWRLHPRTPRMENVRELEALLDEWRKKSVLLVTVNNVHPHVSRDRQLDDALYRGFYERMHAFHHYSNTSMQLIKQAYPSSEGKCHVVTPGFSLAHLVPEQYDREQLRQELGLAADEYAVFLFGAIRRADECRLLREAMKLLEGEPVRLLLLSRFRGTRRTVRGFLTSRRWERWRKSMVDSGRAIWRPGRVEDEDVYQYAIPADAIVVPRIDSLNSGLVFLGQTFGTTVIAPDHGSYPDQLTGTDNPIYETGNPQSLAEVIREEIRKRETAQSMQRSQGEGVWSWADICAACADCVREVST